jgi:hypothetical protein
LPIGKGIGYVSNDPRSGRNVSRITSRAKFANERIAIISRQRDASGCK